MARGSHSPLRGVLGIMGVAGHRQQEENLVAEEREKMLASLGWGALFPQSSSP